jgi:hypothetical protein
LDLSDILAFGKAACDKSNYAPLGWNGVIARRTLKDIFEQRNMRVFIARKNKQICGLLIGSIDPMPFCAGLSATDLVFAADAGGDMLLDLFVAWCKLNKVARIDMGVSQEGQSEEALSKLYERAGFVRAGRMFYMQETPQ